MCLHYFNCLYCRLSHSPQCYAYVGLFLSSFTVIHACERVTHAMQSGQVTCMVEEVTCTGTSVSLLLLHLMAVRERERERERVKLLLRLLGASEYVFACVYRKPVE